MARPAHHHASAGPSQRQLRVGEAVRHALVDILRRADFHDPDVAREAGRVTVTEVRMSPDLKAARVFVMPLGGEDVAGSLATLRKAAPAMRAQLARTLDLRTVPRLAFEADTSFDHAQRIANLLRAPDVARDLEDEPPKE